METKNVKWIVASVIVVLIAIVMAIVWPFTVISAGEVGVVKNFGSINRVLNSGIHWVTPFTESVTKIDITIQKEQTKVAAASKDLQTVSTEVALQYNVDASKLTDLISRVGENYRDTIIDPAIQESVKAATANYTAEELITKRQSVKDEIRTSLTVRLGKDDLIVNDLSITDFDFSASFNSAIEAKVTAEQDALAQKNKLAQVQYEAQQRVAQATAEAEAIKIQAQAVTQQGGEDYVRLQAINRWDGHLPQQFIPGMSLPFLNVIK